MLTRFREPSRTMTRRMLAGILMAAGVLVSGNNGAQEAASRVSPPPTNATEPNRHVPSRDSQAGSLVFALPLRDNVVVYYPEGFRSSAAVFSRPSRATDQSQAAVGRETPRFYTVNGKRGLLVENGSGDMSTTISRSAVNLLPQAARCESADGWHAGAAVILATTGDAVEGDCALEIKVPASAVSAEPGIPVAEFTLPEGLPDGKYLFSFYAKSAQPVSLQATVSMAENTVSAPSSGPVSDASAATGVALATETIACSDAVWKRYYFPFHARTASATPVRISFRVMNPSGNGFPLAITLDALQLEPSGMYAHRLMPSTWIHPGDFRASESLLLPETPGAMPEGTLCFSFAPFGGGTSSRLYQIGGNGWKPELAIDLKRASSEDGVRTDVVVAIGGERVSMPVAETPDGWHRLLLAWSKKTVVLRLDDQEPVTQSLSAEPSFSGSHSLGGSSDRFSPNLKADAIMADYALFAEALPDGPMALSDTWFDKIATLPAPLLRTPCRVFSMDQRESVFRWDAQGFSAIILSGGNAKPAAPANGSICVPFDPAWLMPGKYDLPFVAQATTGDAVTFSLPVEIVPPRTPWGNLQVCSWADGSQTREDGVTLTGIPDMSALRIDAAARRGQYSHVKLDFLGEPRGLADDWAVTVEGNRYYPNPASPPVWETIEDVSRLWAAAFRDFPNLKACILNSEKHAGSIQIDFSAATRQWAQDRFGLDLSLWQTSKIPLFHRIMPMGYLCTQPVAGLVPPSRIIPLSHPLYAFLRAWHTEPGHGDTTANDVYAQRILENRADALVMKDPVLRRPPLQAYRKVNLHQDWVYYTDPKLIVAAAEALQCGARPSGASISVMPQFLFKPGMAAPFGGLPTADLLREAAHLACSRPARVMTFWNLNAIFGKRGMSDAEDLNTLFGSDATWQSTATRLKSMEKEPFAWDPALATEFRRLSREFWQPFGALFPRWQNAPRTIAVIKSFASDVFGNVRWGKTSALEQALLDSGAPYDLLWDTDWSAEDSPATGYKLILLPECNALPENVAQDLGRRIAAGAVVLADNACRVELPGLVRIETDSAGQADTPAARLEEEGKLLRQYNGDASHPQYVEEMQRLAERDTEDDNVLQEVWKYVGTALAGPFVVEPGNVCWNHLRAGDADYLVLVNDRRLPGPFYGKYGKVRETGVANTARVVLRPGCGAFVSDLVCGRQTALPDITDDQVLEIPLDPGGIAILLFTGTELDAPELSLKPARRGETLSIDLVQTLNKAGLVPARLSLFPPENSGTQTPLYSVDLVLERGSATLRFPVPHNAPEGDWTVRLETRCPRTASEASFALQ